MAKMMDGLKGQYQDAKIYFILNTELKPEINESVYTVCRHYEVPVITLRDIDKQSGHPSVRGMEAIASQVGARLRR